MTEREQMIKDRQLAYQRIFMGDDGKMNQDAELVLSDLANFCRLYKSTTVVSHVSQQTDVPATFLAEGRREVILRILGNLYVNPAEFFSLTAKEASNE